MNQKPTRKQVVLPAAPYYTPSAPVVPEGYPSPVTTPTESKGKGPALLIALIIGAVLVVGAIMAIPVFYIRSQDQQYTATYLAPIEIRHEVVGEKKNDSLPPVDTLITPDIKKELYEGKGQKVFLITTYKGKDDERSEFVIEPWKTFEETTPAARQKLVQTKSAELQTKLQNLAVYSPREWNFVVLLDDTEGISPQLTAKYRTMYDDLQIDERLKNGDGVTLHFAKLSFTDYIQEKTAVIAKGTGFTEAARNQVKEAEQWLLKPRPAAGNSSVFRGLLNILSEYSKQPRTRVVILSDMMENDAQGTKLNFYKNGETLLAESQWETLDNQILADTKFVPNTDNPPLAGLSVKIYAPPSVVKISKVAKLAQAYSKHLLTKLGAEVETKFG